MSICPNGHEILDGDEYCGTCGSPALQLPGATPSPQHCSNGHENPPDHSFCGRCGLPLDGPEAADPTTDTTQGRGSRRRAITVLGLLATVLAVVGVIALVSSKGEEPAKPVEQANRPATTTTRPETEDERAERLFQEECSKRFVVPIVVEPSELMPKTGSENTTAWFFDIYSEATGAYMAHGVWQISYGRESYNCNQP